MYYKNGYNLDNKMVRTMQDAKNDIIQYDKALGLGKILDECRQEDLEYKSARNVEDKILHLVPGIKIVKFTNGKENYNFYEIITHSEPYSDSYDVYFWFNPHTKKLNYSSITRYTIMHRHLMDCNSNQEIKENCQYVLNLLGDLVELS